MKRDHPADEALEAAGWATGDYGDFLGLSDAERQLVELRVAVALAVRRLRRSLKLTQRQLAARIGSTQPRLARIEAASPDVSLDQLFRSDCGSLALAIATHAIAEFDVELDELHNDSTTVTFSGAYLDAAQETKRRGQTRLAITWGHNTDHRPDLKQLLFILTVAKDGGVPVYFQAKSGNVVDDRTHRSTWDLLRKLAGRLDFLYVADCKLANTENRAYVHGHGGRFLTVLPRTRELALVSGGPSLPAPDHSTTDRAVRERATPLLSRWQRAPGRHDDRAE